MLFRLVHVFRVIRVLMKISFDLQVITITIHKKQPIHINY